MGDFYLDFRPREQRAWKKTAEFLRFFDDMRIEVLDFPEFTLVLSFADDTRLWGPHTTPDGELLVALCGRLAFDHDVWAEAERAEGGGGLACKVVAQRYRTGGVVALEQLDGNFALFVHDRRQARFFLVTDRAGIMPAFGRTGDEPMVYASHPDALADTVGQGHQWDEVSLAEFALTGEVSAPHTYYSRIRALDFGAVTTFDVRPDRVELKARRRYYKSDVEPFAPGEEPQVAERLAGAFQRSLRRRTEPLLGTPGVALSGGLDSRTVLCAIPDRRRVVTFCSYDEENLEFRIARSIAREAGAEFVPLKREWGLYADHAELGVRISGGMGPFSCNHFLGLRERFRELGIANLLTGCYCDYLFKGLGFNRRVSRWTQRERLGDFRQEYYFTHSRAETPLAREVTERLDTLIPPRLWTDEGIRGVLEVERRRVLPLSYEGDNPQRLVPQRVMGWYVPVADQEMIEIHSRATPDMKLNRSMFARAVMRICPPAITAIPDSNTGAPVNASLYREVAHLYRLKFQNRWARFRGSRATTGSWVNWHAYLRENARLRELWERPSPLAWEFFDRVFGKGRVLRDLVSFPSSDLDLYLQLFTLKLWFDWRS